MGSLRVIGLIRLPSLVIFKALSGHTESKHEDEWGDGAEGAERGDEGYALQYGADEEVDVGVAFELDDERVWQEGDEVVLGGGNVV
jgi:hypothetical protein